MELKKCSQCGCEGHFDDCPNKCQNIDTTDESVNEFTSGLYTIISDRERDIGKLAKKLQLYRQKFGEFPEESIVIDMKNELTVEDMERIAEKYSVEVSFRPDDYFFRNGGSCAGRHIWINPCDEQWMVEISFWHELGHILLIDVPDSWGYVMSKLSGEGAAWEIGFHLAARHGRTWHYKSDQINWARKQLASYVGGEYDWLPYKRGQFDNVRNYTDGELSYEDTLKQAKRLFDDYVDRNMPGPDSGVDSRSVPDNVVGSCLVLMHIGEELERISGQEGDQVGNI